MPVPAASARARGLARTPATSAFARGPAGSWTPGRSPATPAGCPAPGPPAARHRARGWRDAIRRARPRSLGLELDVPGDQERAARRRPWRPPWDAAAAARSPGRQPSAPGPSPGPRTRAAGCPPGLAGRAAVAARAYRYTGSSYRSRQPGAEVAGQARCRRPWRCRRGARTARRPGRRCGDAGPAARAGRCARWPARRRRASPAITPSAVTREREHAAVVVGVRRAVEEHHARRALARPRAIASTTSRRRPH